MLRWALHSLETCSAVADATRDHASSGKMSSLAESWGRSLDASATTPTARVVNLLKEMSVTLQKDMDEDEELYDKLACWCRDNSASKKNVINANNGKLSELEATIEELTASSAGLKAKIEELEGEVADNKNTLAKATALRHKELAEFNRDETDSVANIANLKAAIVVLSKHQSSALSQVSATLSFLSLRSDSNSDSDEPWGLESKDQRDLDMFMNDNGFGGDVDEDAVPEHTPSSDSRSFAVLRKYRLQSWCKSGLPRMRLLYNRHCDQQPLLHKSEGRTLPLMFLAMHLKVAKSLVC